MSESVEVLRLSTISFLLAIQTAVVSITGTVRDEESRAPLPGVTVSLADLDRAVVTDSGGRYRLDAVPPGPQHVVVRRIGYAPRTFHALVPRHGTLEIDVALRSVPIPIEPIEVRTRVPVRGLDGGTATRFPDRHLSIAAVRNHPGLSEPDVLQAIAGGEVLLRPEAPGGIHVRGGASDQIAYLLDGIPMLNPYHAAGTFGAWNPDALSRLDLFTSSPAPALSDALSGLVSGTTRAPGNRLQTLGSLSNTQARMTAAGPLGSGGAGYVLSLRVAYPGFLASKREGSHVRGDADDWLGKLESPIAGGRLQLLGVGSSTEINASAAEPDSASPVRNVLGWESRSLGLIWERPLGVAFARLRGWAALGDAVAAWGGVDSLPPEGLDAKRRDQGMVAMIEFPVAGGQTAAGIRAQQIRTTYRAGVFSSPDSSLDLRATTAVSTVFVRHDRPVASRGRLDLSLATGIARDDAYLDPAARFEWKLTEELVASCSCSRRSQFAQSLRNPESIVGSIFPTDLYLAAGDEVPVARSDVGIVALEHRPAGGVRLGAQAYARDFKSLLLVAPRTGRPFATSGFANGSGDAYGFALQAAANGARYGLVADYGFQRVRLREQDTTYVPEHGARHAIEGGIIVFPTPTSSVRLGVSSLLGRRGTAVLGPVEWESCNLLDWGCEFAGSPTARSGPLGGTRLPAYVRVDLGLRKHWHLEVWGRDVLLAVFGSASNILGRKNVLAIAVDPATGERTQIEMRPRSPLVLGIDWRF